MATWKKQWQQAYKRDPQSLVPFQIWLSFVKGWTQIEIAEIDLDDDETFALLEEYGNDKEITRMSEECQKEMGI